jgi:hypothetical protein
VPVTLFLLPETFAVCRLAPDAPAPEWASGGDFASVTRTRDELSIVCPAGRVPAGVRSEPGWRCLKVEGPFEFSVTGLLASLTAPLAEARVPTLAVCTFDTDYLLVKEHDLGRALEALRAAGYQA